MKIDLSNLLYAILIGIFLLNLSGCGKKEPHLAIDASIISKGQTKDQVVRLIGRPHVITHNEQGQEEWYYYHDISGFWVKIPLIGRLFGKRKIETTQVVFSNNLVTKVTYYVAER